jgi:hypothetical protein
LVGSDDYYFATAPFSLSNWVISMKAARRQAWQRL